MSKRGSNRRRKHSKAASQIRLSSSNTTNIAANQPSNTSYPAPSVPLQPTNQNLLISAASAAALPLPQQINSTSTNDDMDTSPNDMNDVNNQLFILYYNRLHHLLFNKQQHRRCFNHQEGRQMN